jgi:hypothetical protein
MLISLSCLSSRQTPSSCKKSTRTTGTHKGTIHPVQLDFPASATCWPIQPGCRVLVGLYRERHPRQSSHAPAIVTNPRVALWRTTRRLYRGWKICLPITSRRATNRPIRTPLSRSGYPRPCRAPCETMADFFDLLLRDNAISSIQWPVVISSLIHSQGACP